MARLGRFVCLPLIATIFLLFLAPRPCRAGEGDEVLAGFLLGTSMGLVAGGAVTILYKNRDADRNFTTIMITSTLIGAVVGTIFGLALPDDAMEKDPVFSLDTRKERHWNISVPTVSFGYVASRKGPSPGGQTDLLKVVF